MAPKLTATSLAKSLAIATKEITSILNNYIPREGRKASDALTPEEISVVFEKITQDKQDPEFAAYKELVKSIKRAEIDKQRKLALEKLEKERAEAEEEARRQAEEKARIEAEERAKREAAEAEAKAKREAEEKARKEAEDALKSEEQKAKEAEEARKKAESEAEIARKLEENRLAKEAKKKAEAEARAKEKAEQPDDAPERGEKKKVNTSNTVVNLGKYDDRYEDLAGSDSNQSRSKRSGDRQNKDSGGKQKKKGGQPKQNPASNKQQPQQTQKKPPKKSKKETEAERKKRLEAERASRDLKITIPEEISVTELASLLRVTATEIVGKLFISLNKAVNVNSVIDYDTAEYVASELGATVEKEVVVSLEERFTDMSEDDEADLVTRDPVVVVMGHVDHGKTSILDAIRHTAVTSTEAGGITQHIGAYRVRVGDNKITFLDTPGHEAFTTMRARGAMATDVAVLVVAADDGIMPQTIEAINHAKAAGVQVIVAINKMDKEGANPERIKQQLTEHELVPEEWGGDTICVPVSAKTKEGIDDLLENILLVAEMLELKANPNRSATGVVIEAKLDKNRGPLATILVQNGTLHADDVIVAGTSWGKIRGMTNENGKKVKKAGPAVPVEIMGLDLVPNAGDHFVVANGEKGARQIAEQKREEAKQEQFNRYNKVTMENLFSAISEGELKELSIIVKADVQGSVEAVTQNLEKLSNEEVRVKVIHGAVGTVNESDIQLASSSNAIIVGFNIRPDAAAISSAERLGVDMRMYRVIYECLEEIQAAMKGMLAPKFREQVLGAAEIRNVFTISKVGKIAGCYVTEGKVERNALVRLVRDGIILADDTVSSLQRGKDAVKEVATGFECGIGLEKYSDIKEGDILEFYIMEEYRD